VRQICRSFVRTVAAVHNSLAGAMDRKSTGLYHRRLAGFTGLRDSGLQDMMRVSAKFALGEVVRHRVHPFRGVIFDVDPTFNNTNEWWESIPEESRPRKDQPFYHLLAENETSYYVAYVSEQNLVRDDSGDPVDHPEVSAMFGALREGGRYDLDGHLH
jgi:heat shock protein HspQ